MFLHRYLIHVDMSIRQINNGVPFLFFYIRKSARHAINKINLFYHLSDRRTDICAQMFQLFEIYPVLKTKQVYLGTGNFHS